MHNMVSTRLVRDCTATRIPSGEQEVLPAGAEVDITQSLGGSYTVRTPMGLFRIKAADGEALGLQPAAEAVAAASAPTGPVDENAVMAVLRNCYDPEIPVNIVDLGLVYDLSLEALPSGRSSVAVKMTLTAPGCGMGGAIAGDAQHKLLELPGVEEAHVEIVWDPPWSPAMITDAGKKVLGIE
jgi:probable FeS assembly SUF system protein SufT